MCARWTPFWGPARTKGWSAPSSAPPWTPGSRCAGRRRRRKLGAPRPVSRIPEGSSSAKVPAEHRCPCTCGQTPFLTGPLCCCWTANTPCSFLTGTWMCFCTFISRPPPSENHLLCFCRIIYNKKKLPPLCARQPPHTSVSAGSHIRCMRPLFVLAERKRLKLVGEYTTPTTTTYEGAQSMNVECTCRAPAWPFLSCGKCSRHHFL